MSNKSRDAVYADLRVLPTRLHQASCLKVPIYASAIAQRAAEYYGSVEFNKLHTSIRALPGIKEFNRVQKAGLKMLLHVNVLRHISKPVRICMYLPFLQC